MELLSSRGGGGGSGTGSAVDTLLSRALQLSRRFIKPRNSTGPARLKPARLAFSTSYTQKLKLGDADAASRYLSLPASNYSVLSSQFVSRAPDSDNIFVLNIPLGSSGTGGLMSTSGYNAKIAPVLAATLSTSVTVDPQPLLRRVEMSSGPIFFTPSNSNSQNVSSTTAKVETWHEPAIDPLAAPQSLADAFPEWLLWGGRSGDANSASSSPSSSPSPDGAVKSSVQAGFRVELSWPENPTFALLASSNTGTDESSDTLQRGESILDVRARIEVWVQMNLPIQEEVSAAVNFPPVRLLLEQAGRLTTGAVLKSIAPAFAELLVRDHDSRRGISSTTIVQPSRSNEPGILSTYADAFML